MNDIKDDVSAERVEKLIEESELKKQCFNLEEWNKIIKEIPGYSETKTLSKILKILANPIRLKIILILLEREWACNCEFEHAFQSHQTLISHHLRSLRNAGLITFTKSGQWNFYHLEEKYKDYLIKVRDLLLAVIAI
jgi:ArsR family transcriptional regulator